MATTDRKISPSGDASVRGASRWLRRVGWLIAIWAGSVACLFVAAWLLKAFMRLAGLTA